MLIRKEPCPNICLLSPANEVQVIVLEKMATLLLIMEFFTEHK